MELAHDAQPYVGPWFTLSRKVTPAELEAVWAKECERCRKAKPVVYQHDGNAVAWFNYPAQLTLEPRGQ